MIRTLAVLLLSALPAWATTDGWPALHDVIGVAAGDTLNIRAEPSASSPIVGTFAPDATDIEVIRPNDDYTWGLVNHGEGSGWVSLTYLAPQPGQWYGMPPALTQCFGTEPFWSLAFGDGGTVTWSTPEETGQGTVLQTWETLSRRDLHALSLRIASGIDPARDGVAMVSVDQCSDGMSDRAFGLRIDMLLGDTANQVLYSGCCTIQPPAAK